MMPAVGAPARQLLLGPLGAAAPPLRWLLCTATLMALGACSSLLPKPAPQPAYFALNGAVPNTGTATPASARSPSATVTLASIPMAPRQPNATRAAATAGAKAPVLVVLPAKAAPGFDSARIIYTRQAHRLEYFARSEWVDTPARMLTPLLVAALDASGGFAAVVMAPSVATGSVMLDIQMLRLQHEFGSAPSQVRLALRAQLIDGSSLRVLATRDFEHTETSASEDAAGGVAASQAAVHAVLAEVARWCRAAVPGAG